MQKAQTTLGRMYESGKGVAENDVEAVKWYRKATDSYFELFIKKGWQFATTLIHQTHLRCHKHPN